jgi:hypothetical protein
MTPDECWAAAKRLGLKPTAVPNVYRDSSGNLYNVPEWERFSAEERTYLVKRLTMNVRGFEDADEVEARPPAPA